MYTVTSFFQSAKPVGILSRMLGTFWLVSEEAGQQRPWTRIGDTGNHQELIDVGGVLLITGEMEGLIWKYFFFPCA